MVRLGTPRLDFLVIGAQKAGTTSLWRYLEDNPALRFPPAKEAPFFIEPAYPDQLRGYMRALFKDAPRRARLGTVTPPYTTGSPGIPVSEIVRRIRATVPDVRLVVLLRDPVERAFSAHRMQTRRDAERRSFEQAIAEQLEPAALERGRRGPAEHESYVTAGEYGRIIETYLAAFPREQLHVELTTDLASAPEAVVARVCAFLGVEPHEPRRLAERFHESGTRRVTPSAERDLKDHLGRHVWPRIRHPDQHRDSFDRFFDLWNVEPELLEQPAATGVTASLREHYGADTEKLVALTGCAVPWAEA
jgi:hypothetical protein